MTLTTWVALAAIIGCLSGIVTVVLTARGQARAAAAGRREEIEDAVKEAVRPIENDRDYWRNRADRLEAELRRPGGGSG